MDVVLDKHRSPVIDEWIIPFVLRRNFMDMELKFIILTHDATIGKKINFMPPLTGADHQSEGSVFFKNDTLQRIH
jgi:hypothetical protein